MLRLCAHIRHKGKEVGCQFLLPDFPYECLLAAVKNKKSIRDTVFMAFWLARPALSSYRYAINVRIFSLQPWLRIDFFETKRLLTEKNAFLRRVGKRLSIRTISTYPLSGVFLSGSKNRHPYRIGTAILIGQAVSFLRYDTAYPIGMSLPFL